jgi:hypothetical protein
VTVFFGQSVVRSDKDGSDAGDVRTSPGLWCHRSVNITGATNPQSLRCAFALRDSLMGFIFFATVCVWIVAGSANRYTCATICRTIHADPIPEQTRSLPMVDVQYCDFGGVVEGGRIDELRCGDGIRIADTVIGNVNSGINGYIAITAQDIQSVHEFLTTEEDRIVHRNDLSPIFNQGAGFVDEPNHMLFKVHSATAGGGEKWWIQNDAIKFSLLPLQLSRDHKKVTAYEIAFDHRKPIHGVRLFGQVEERAIQIGLNHRCAGRHCGNTDTACIGKRIQYAFSTKGFCCPASQITGVHIEARIPVHGNIQRKPYPVFLNACIHPLTLFHDTVAFA